MYLSELGGPAHHINSHRVVESNMAYRTEAKLPPEPETIQVGREEYAHLIRAEKVLYILETQGEDVHKLYGDPCRWEVALYGEDPREADGRSLQGAVEKAARLAPVEPWYPPAPVGRLTWFRFFTLGIVISQVFEWYLDHLPW